MMLRAGSTAFERGRAKGHPCTHGKASGLEPEARSTRKRCVQRASIRSRKKSHLRASHPARSVRAQPYPFGELACCFEPVNVCIAVEDEVSYLFLREQAQFLRHHGHSGWGASRDAPGVSLGTEQTDLSWRAVQDSANEISTSKSKSRRAHLGWRALNASSDGQGVMRLFSLPRRAMPASAVVHPL